MLGTPLIRLQCFEGIDASEALYEWNYPRQLLGIRVAEAKGANLEEESLFSREYLIERPLLQALEHPGPQPAVLLIDEVDRADEEFEAFLFEMLAESSVTVPEIGTLRAKVPPVVILTSNRTRDLHDALKRRCLYHWIDYPDLEHATRIVRLRVPEAPARADRAGRRGGPAAARHRRAEAAGRRRGDRLGQRGDAAGHPRPRRRGRRPDPRLGAEVPRGPGRRPRRGPRLGRGRLIGPAMSGVDSPSSRRGLFARIVAGFGHLLHSAGVPVTPERRTRFGTAVALARPTTIDELYWLGRVTLLTARDQAETYDAVFRQVFRGHDRHGGLPGRQQRAGAAVVDAHAATASPATRSARGSREHRPAGHERDARCAGRRGRQEDEAPSALAAVSQDERLAGKDFAACSEEELALIRRLVEQLPLVPPMRTGRRLRRHSGGSRMDIRGTLRRAHRTAGDPVVLVQRKRTERPRRVVLIADVSGSMEPYARIYLHLMRGAVQALHAEAFVFATRLTRLTRALQATHPDLAYRKAAAAAPDWSGGTRIGRALADFLDCYGRRGMARGAVIVIVSDGWEIDGPGAGGHVDGAAVAPGPPHHLGQPAQGGRVVRAARRRDGGGPAVRRHLRLGPLPARARGRHGRHPDGDRSQRPPPATAGIGFPHERRTPLTHLNERGEARMVDVTAKEVTRGRRRRGAG